MKKRSFVILILVIVLIVACLFCACDSNDIPFGVPVGWQKYLSELAEYFADRVDLCGDIISFGLSGHALLKDAYLDIDIKGNLDLSDLNRDNFSFIIKDSDGKTLFSVLSDNADTYIEIAPNPYVSNAKLKLQETCIFGLLSGALSSENDFSELIRDGVVSFGTSFFNSADVNADKTEYIFGINGNQFGKRLYEYFTALSFVDEEITSVALGIVGIKNIDDLLSDFNDIDGEAVFHIEGESVNRIEIRDAGGGKVSLSLDMDISGKYNESVAELFPESDSGYKVTKVGSTTMDGTVSYISSVGNKYAVKYDMSLNTDIDLFSFALSGFNLSALGDDNFFHFRLSHKCTDDCTEYCRSRIAAAKGAIIDIAFSPEQFGTDNIYICLNIRSVMSREYIDSITRYLKSITVSSMPDYCMFVVPASNVMENRALLKLLYDSYIKMMNIGVGESEFVDLNELREDFADNQLADTILADMFVSEEYDIDTLKIKVDRNIYGQAYDYDIYKETVYLIDTDVSELKSYKTPLGKDYTAYRWEYEERKYAKDGDKTYKLNNIYDLTGNNLLHGSDSEGNYVPMSDLEARDIIGCSLRLDYSGYDGENKYAYGEIIGVEGIDYSCFEEQEVTLRVKYPSIFDYTFEFGDISEKILEGFFRYGNDLFSQNVKVRIKLTREIENAFEFRSADTENLYRLTYLSEAPELLNATAVVHYQNGAVKEISTIGESESVIKTKSIFTRYSIVDWGRITVRFKVAGRIVNRYFNIEKPDSFEFTTREYTEMLGESCYIENYVTVRAVYGDKKVNLKLTLKDFYINGLSLDDDSADWDHYTSYTNRYVVFYKSSDYIVQVRKLGVTFGEYILHITNKIEQPATYKFDTQSEVPSIVLPNVKINISGHIVNKTHGNGDGDFHSVEVTVEEYRVTGTTLIFYEADKSDYSLQFKVASGAASDENKAEVFLPALIVNPVSLQAGIVFNKAGTYRISIKLDRVTSYSVIVRVME